MTRLRTRDISTDRIASSVYIEGGALASDPASLGQKAMAASSPVAIASDQSAVSIKGTGAALTDRSGTIDPSAQRLDHAVVVDMHDAEA